MQEKIVRPAAAKAVRSAKGAPELRVISSQAREPEPQALITDTSANLGTDYYLVDELLTPE